MITFDIETEPFPEEELAAILPEFDESSVAIGNRGPDKAAEYIAQKRAEYEAKFFDQAALSPTTGTILAIGYYSPDKDKFSLDAVDEVVADGAGSEGALLTRFWKLFNSMREQGRSMIGVNITEFDLPFICRRSYMLGVDVPDCAFTNRSRRYFSDTFVDVSTLWLCGERWGSTPSNFDALARAFSTNGKPGNCSGKDFSRLWHNGGEDRAAAIVYLESDVKQPAIWAQRMGVLK